MKRKIQLVVFLCNHPPTIHSSVPFIRSSHPSHPIHPSIHPSPSIPSQPVTPMSYPTNNTTFFDQSSNVDPQAPSPLQQQQQQHDEKYGGQQQQQQQQQQQRQPLSLAESHESHPLLHNYQQLHGNKDPLQEKNNTLRPAYTIFGLLVGLAFLALRFSTTNPDNTGDEIIFSLAEILAAVLCGLVLIVLLVNREKSSDWRVNTELQVYFVGFGGVLFTNLTNAMLKGDSDPLATTEFAFMASENVLEAAVLTLLYGCVKYSWKAEVSICGKSINVIPLFCFTFAYMATINCAWFISDISQQFTIDLNIGIFEPLFFAMFVDFRLLSFLSFTKLTFIVKQDASSSDHSPSGSSPTNTLLLSIDLYSAHSEEEKPDLIHSDPDKSKKWTPARLMWGLGGAVLSMVSGAFLAYDKVQTNNPNRSEAFCIIMTIVLLVSSLWLLWRIVKLMLFGRRVKFFASNAVEILSYFVLFIITFIGTFSDLRYSLLNGLISQGCYLVVYAIFLILSCMLVSALLLGYKSRIEETHPVSFGFVGFLVGISSIQLIVAIFSGLNPGIIFGALAEATAVDFHLHSLLYFRKMQLECKDNLVSLCIKEEN